MNSIYAKCDKMQENLKSVGKYNAGEKIQVRQIWSLVLVLSEVYLLLLCGILHLNHI